MRLNFKYRIAALSVVIATFICLVARASSAQEQYPSKPIHFVLAQPAGGAVELVSRALADRLSEILYQAVIVDNQPGENGNVAGGRSR